MSRKKKRQYVIAGCFDTETSNIGSGQNTHAICILYIFNDLRNRDLRNYNPKNDTVQFYRYENEMQNQIDEIVSWGEKTKQIPIICAYNLMFDMQTLMYDLNLRYEMRANAQSSTNVYTLDLQKDGITVLRFWDCYHLEMRGLAAMGETCGLEKANGSWDYSKVRTCETPLTDEELFYAARDVQVIPAYLKYLLNANEWLKQVDLGSRVITKTSLVRQMATKQIGTIKVIKDNGKPLTLQKAFENMCKRQLPDTFEQYALRKACFRGGLTFTSAKYASVLVENVVSMDVTSMHHAFINGRYVPVDFDVVPNSVLRAHCEYVLSRTIEDVLSSYHKPFICAFHARIKFTNIRLKKGSCFEKWQIGVIPSGKFRTVLSEAAEYGNDDRQTMQDELVRNLGWHDKALKPVFAFGKLYEAEICELHLSELELWTIAQVYDWDSYEVIFGESTVKWKKPPDYVTLQSNMLFETKNDAKIINKNYEEGKPYDREIPETIPIGIARALRQGTLSGQFFEAYYNSTVKGMFNGIYGTMAQDVFKPDFQVESGELSVDKGTRTNEANYDEKIPSKCKVLYTYGLRIVGGSRMHLVIAMQLLFNGLGDKISITGGDTDSIKARVDRSITNAKLLETLAPLHNAINVAIDFSMQRVRKIHQRFSSNLERIGQFDIESCGGYERWKYHMECWNKARVSISQDNKVHVTCAGLSRPIGEYHIEHFIADLIKDTDDIAGVVSNTIGYNVFVPHALCFSLEHRRPLASTIYENTITDYLGKTVKVKQKEAIALYESGRQLGDTNKRTNADNVRYLRHIGISVDDDMKFLEVDDEKVRITKMGQLLFEGQRRKDD